MTRSEFLKGNKKSARKNARPVMIDDIEYSSVQSAGELNKLHTKYIRDRLFDPNDKKAYYIGFEKKKDNWWD